jgi:hypothetical protein
MILIQNFTCSTLDRTIKLALSTGRTCDASRLMGEKLAGLFEKKYYKIVFAVLFISWTHKALADGARAGGFAILN